MVGRQVDHDITASVETPGVVVIEEAGHPVRPVPRLPPQRRIGRIDADTVDLAIDTDRDRVPRCWLVETDVERVAGRRQLGERGKAPTDLHLVGPVTHALDLGLLRHHVGEFGRQDGQLRQRREHHRLVHLTAKGRRTRPGGDHERRRGRRRQPERDVHAGGSRGEQPDADQFEELPVQPIRHPVQPIQQLVGHERKCLDQRDARIGDVVIGPGRAAIHHYPLGVVDQVLEPTIVEIRHRDGHQASLPRASGTAPRPRRVRHSISSHSRRRGSCRRGRPGCAGRSSV